MVYFFDFPKIGYFNFNIYWLSVFEFVSCIFALSIKNNGDHFFRLRTNSNPVGSEILILKQIL